MLYNLKLCQIKKSYWKYRHYEENDYKNPHKGRGIWIIAEEKETKVQHRFKSMRSCEKFTGIDRHRIKHFLKGERNNWTKFNFYYDE